MSNTEDQINEVDKDNYEETAMEIAQESQEALRVRLLECEFYSLLQNPEHFAKHYYAQFLQTEDGSWVNGNVWKDRLIMVTIGIPENNGITTFSIRRNDLVESRENAEELAKILLDVFEQEKTAYQQKNLLR